MVNTDGAPKEYYTVTLDYDSYPTLIGTPRNGAPLQQSESIQKRATLRKTYGDFKHLAEFVSVSDLELDGASIQNLPPKRSASGLKKSGMELQA